MIMGARTKAGANGPKPELTHAGTIGHLDLGLWLVFGLGFGLEQGLGMGNRHITAPGILAGRYMGEIPRIQLA